MEGMEAKGNGQGQVKEDGKAKSVALKVEVERALRNEAKEETQEFATRIARGLVYLAFYGLGFKLKDLEAMATAQGFAFARSRIDASIRAARVSQHCEREGITMPTGLRISFLNVLETLRGKGVDAVQFATALQDACMPSMTVKAWRAKYLPSPVLTNEQEIENAISRFNAALSALVELDAVPQIVSAILNHEGLKEHHSFILQSAIEAVEASKESAPVPVESAKEEKAVPVAA